MQRQKSGPTSWRWLRAAGLLGSLSLLVGAAPPVKFTDLATAFERAADASRDQPMAQRIEATRRSFDAILPGVYGHHAVSDSRIAAALADFPAQRQGYDRVVREFPTAFQSAIGRFRQVFPAFVPSIPIYLYHSLGVRDGGSDYLAPGHRHVMFFGADMIAKLHDDDSLQPFLDHELFHLEHAHAFPDCDQFWCTLWQEGLALDAAATMTPGATDHQLLLDVPGPIRAPTDAHWTEALCFVASHFDSTDAAVTAQGMMVEGRPPVPLPDRFAYYVGYRIAQAMGRSLPVLDRLGHEAARPLVRATLVRLMADANAKCALPSTNAKITSSAPHPV